MLENWCWTPSQLKALSNHYETGEKITDDLVGKLVKTRHVNRAMYNLRQLHVGIFDMAVHTPKTHKDAKEIKIPELFNELRTQISGVKGPEALGMSRYASCL